VIAGNPASGKVYIGRVGAFPTGDIIVINDQTTNISATLPVSYQPSAIAVNQATNRIYVVPWAPVDTMYIINGLTDNLTEVVASSQSFYRMDVAVNQVTNKVYIAGYMWAGGPYNIYLSIFRGDTYTYTPTLDLGSGSNWAPRIAVVTSTNKIYVTGQNAVLVIDGSSDVVSSTIPVGLYPQDIAVNPTTNYLYVANRDSNSVSVIDGLSDSVVATVTVGISPKAIALNPMTNRIYVANNGDGTVSVIDGASNIVSTTVSVGGTPSMLAVDTALNRVYVGTGTHLKAIDGDTNVVYEPALVYQPSHAYSYLQDLSVMASHKVYVADRHGYDDYGWWYILADIDLSASTVEAAPTVVAADNVSQSTITVTLRDSLGVPVSGVAISITASGSGNTITGSGTRTDSNGQMTGLLQSSVPEQKIITATLPEGVSLANTTVVTFARYATVDTTTGGMITDTTSSGATIMIQIPVGAVTTTTQLLYTPILTTSSTPSSTFAFAGYAFSLNAYQNGAYVPLIFTNPITVFIEYTNADVINLNESTLTLYYWNGTRWASDGIVVVERDAERNRIVVTLGHLSEFALFGQITYRVFLPRLMSKSSAE